MITRPHGLLAILAALMLASLAAEEPAPAPHPIVGQYFVPVDVDWSHPVYATAFDDSSALQAWTLEGGKRMSVAEGRLVLESDAVAGAPPVEDQHLVCWLKREMPADFLLEFKMRPRSRKDGLAIIFFSTRGLHGESIFDPTLARRTGVFQQYHSGDLNGYHVSYWAGDRGTAHIRKNQGFALVASGPDLVAKAPNEAWQNIRLHKRGGKIRLMVDDIVSVAYDDDGKVHGPVWTHTGWIGLRQMSHTIRCEYDDVKVYPLNP